MKLFELQSEIHLSECRKKAFAFITLFIIILSIYSNTFDASWHFDDIPNIVENKALHLTKLSWTNIKKAFFSLPEPTRKLYRPVACLSFALNYYLGKDAVLGYHIVNISIHFLAAIFLFLFIYHTLNLPILHAKYGLNSYFIALLATVLWAINPVQTQAVTYIVQRMASMAGMLYIMSMYFYLKARKATQNPEKILLFFVCAITALLAFGSKENAILLPASLFLYDFFLIQGISRENTKRNLKVLLVVSILVLSTCIVYFALSEATFSSLFGLYSKRPFTLWDRLITQPRINIFYISLLIYPMSNRLSVDHDISISSSLFSPPTTILSVMLIIGIITGAIFISKRKPLISFSILFFFLNHLIESSILPLELVFEHRNYIPSMLFFVPIAIGLLTAISYFSYKRSMQVIITLSIILVLIGEGHATFMRNFTWKNEESLWIDCIDKYPQLFRAHHNLGRYYADNNEEEKAIKEYQKAIQLESIHNTIEKSVTFANLGTIFFLKEELEKAKNYYLEAIRIDPCSRGAHNNLGALLAITTDDYRGVFNELKKEIDCDEYSAHAHSNMGILLIKMGRLGEGIATLEGALEIDPYNIGTLERLGYAYIKKRRLGTASIYFKKALKQGHIRALLYLAEIYIIGGHKQKAQDSLSQFLGLVEDRNLDSFLDELLGEESLLKTTPNMDIVLPRLCKAYKEKVKFFKKNRGFCLNTLIKSAYDMKEKKVRQNGEDTFRALPPHLEEQF